MVAHSDEKYQCEEMSDCPYTGTTLIEKIPWSGEVGADKEEDQAEESTTIRVREQGQEESNTARKQGLLNKIKRLFRK